MRVLLWVGIAPAALVVLAIGLRALGAARWAEMIRTHTTQRQSGRIGAQDRLPSPARFDAHGLVGLPPPVQRCFRAVLTDGQPTIAAATLEVSGTMNMSATGAHWKPATSRQRVVTRRPGFLWHAQVFMFPGLPARVEDSHIAGHGRLIAKLFGRFTVADSPGEGEIARGEFMRCFAESPWYPTAWLPSQGVRRAAVDHASARATPRRWHDHLDPAVPLHRGGPDRLGARRGAGRGGGRAGRCRRPSGRRCPGPQPC